MEVDMTEFTIKIEATADGVTQTTKCPRCGGKGEIPAYSHYFGGLCLLCRGKGTIRKRPAARPRASVVPVAAEPPSHAADCECLFCPMGGWINV
jgi:hypothetical protein